MSTWTTPATWANAAVTANQMNVEIRDHANYLKAALDNNGIISDVGKQKLTPALVGARAATSSAVALVTTVDTAVALGAETFDSDAFHDNTTNNSRITIPSGMGGVYAMGAYVGFAANSTGHRRIILRLNGSVDMVASMVGGLPGGFLIPLNVDMVYQFVPTDYVQIFAYQNSGANLDVSTAALWIHRLSST